MQIILHCLIIATSLCFKKIKHKSQPECIILPLLSKTVYEKTLFLSNTFSYLSPIVVGVKMQVSRGTRQMRTIRKQGLVKDD